VAGLTIASASRQSKNRAIAIIVIALLEEGKLLAEEEILGDECGAGAKKETDEWMQL
jgi:hypothetical protein